MDQTEILGLKAHELMSIDTGTYIREIKNYGSQSRSSLHYNLAKPTLV